MVTRVGLISNRSPIRRNGLTLIEVVVGLVLLAAVMVAQVHVYRNHSRASADAGQILLATEVADGVLRQLHSRRGGFPRRSGGRPRSRPSWSWTTRPMRREVVAGVPVEIIRFEMTWRPGRPPIRVDLAMALSLPRLQPSSTEESS